MSTAEQKTENLPAETKNLQTLNGLLARMKPQIKMALPRHLTPERLIRITMTAWSRTPALQDCSPMSVLASVVQAAQLGLEPDNVLGHAYLVPFYNNKTKQKECQLITGYKGLLDLARRSGQIQAIDSQVVYERDHFIYRLGLDPKLEHVPSEDDDRGKITHAWAVARFKDGGTQCEIMSRAQIDKIKASSKAADFGPWKTHYDEMARKTVLRRLCKFLPLSPEIQRQVSSEELADAGIIESAIIDQADAPDKPEKPPTGRTHLGNGHHQEQTKTEERMQEQPPERQPGEDQAEQDAPLIGEGVDDSDMRRQALCADVRQAIKEATSQHDLQGSAGRLLNDNRDFLGDEFRSLHNDFSARFKALTPTTPMPSSQPTRTRRSV